MTGIATTPDYDAPLRKMSDTIVDSKNFGTAFVGKRAYIKLKQSHLAAQSEEYLYDCLLYTSDSRTWPSMCDFLSIGRYKKNIFKKIRSGKELTMKAKYQTHTTRCQHAFGEDREYVEEAILAGLRILGFSDHCPWIYKSDYVSNIRMTPQETDDYFLSLEKLRREYEKDIDIFIGFESEYLPELMLSLIHI